MRLAILLSPSFFVIFSQIYWITFVFFAIFLFANTPVPRIFELFTFHMYFYILIVTKINSKCLQFLNIHFYECSSRLRKATTINTYTTPKDAPITIDKIKYNKGLLDDL